MQKTQNSFSDRLQRFRSHPLAWNLTLIVALMLILAIAAHLLMLAGTRHGARRTVPDFAGMPLADAQREAARHDLRLSINDSLFVPAYDGGIVLDQLPERGVEVKPGRTVYVTINSFRQKTVEIPYVAGRSLRQAKNMLEIAGLEIAELVYRSDLATNYVLEERYEGRAVTDRNRLTAEIGSGVTLCVGVSDDAGTVIAPRLAGLTLREAKSRLWEQGLNVGEILFDEGINLLNQKEALVYDHTPVQGADLAYGAKVSLRLTLDTAKAARSAAEAERRAQELAEERLRAEQEAADSLARLQLEESIRGGAAEPATDDEGFFE